MKKQEYKEELRRKMRRVLADIKGRPQRSGRIFKALAGLDRFRRARHVFTYVSKKNEVDTIRIIEYCLKKGKKVYVPLINLRKNSIDVYRITKLDCLEKCSYNILEPIPARAVKSRRQSFDIILVPGLAFDPDRNRLGRGRGYFDRFLGKVKGHKVGLCFQEQVCSRVPQGPGDVAVDRVLTDRIQKNPY